MTRWKYDADQDHPLAARRIPVVDSEWPVWFYELAVVIHPGQGIEPDNDEVPLLESALAYRMDYYNASWAARMRREPLDVDSSTNTLILTKSPEKGWRYRRRTWWHGSMPRYDSPDRLTLLDALDRAFNGGLWPDDDGPWDRWKSERPEVFSVRAEVSS